MKSSNEKLFGALALCRKAGKLKTGFDAAEYAIKKGVDLVVVTSDISQRTLRNVSLLCGEKTAIKQLAITQYQAEEAVGKRFVVAAVTDRNLSELVKLCADEEAFK